MERKRTTQVRNGKRLASWAVLSSGWTVRGILSGRVASSGRDGFG